MSFCEARVSDDGGNILARVLYRVDDFAGVYRGNDVARIRENIANEAWQSYTLRRLGDADCGFATRLVLDEGGVITELPLPRLGNERFDFGLLKHVGEHELMKKIESLLEKVRDFEDRIGDIRDLTE